MFLIINLILLLTVPPLKIIINEQENGSIIFSDYKSITIKTINNLSLSNNKDIFQPYLGTTSNLYTHAALIDENGNGIVIYELSSNIPSENTFKTSGNSKDKVIYGSYAIDVKNNQFVKDSTRKINVTYGDYVSSIDYKTPYDLIKTKNGKYIFWYISKLSFGSDFLSMTEINSKESVDYPNISNLLISRRNFNLSLDNDGNGYYFYIDTHGKEEKTIFTYLKSYEAQKDSTITYKSDIEVGNFFYLINLNLDEKGDGFILRRGDNGVVLYQVSNFENLSNMNVLINRNDDHLGNREIKLDKSGNGYLIFDDPDTLDATFKKITNYKSVKDFKLTDYKLKGTPYIKSYLPIFTVSLNSKGDGLVILKNLQDDLSYFVRKIKNYEPI